jgi:hypothetical protein
VGIPLSAEVGADVTVREVDDVVVDTGGRFSSPEVSHTPGAAFWADNDALATAGCFFLAAGMVFWGIKNSVEKSDCTQK